ncbi:PLP-dependent aminotransferase family protein [Afifella marina]|uniref:DNA-binding transcriptional regulator, MocR family, contains an aminotransferase domain n=1 Tax=Afifella marina DSM 2698 TaxID=1120955 RepID=A0A1G5PAH8_AFIMA|nr:PLP-dependent aminotransferase family protein [Afifella marina]MBK1625484.1 PLP-dependent aminotransferase family protein [Afifella marina DSM 2698]MBK1629103.1 PLP-dependent aminotransferase family protein [Afifella marina]MBK5918894.1 hypothetical protein [Afifella marina]RAI17419.1 hypothetical protein CH311_18230 [Afifella marina DSM 2698]SCZ46573.1 DNA-binding transcriptional regulator, MocR family, contains an aminotransferase domain [Afifella marina DSM 2698]
MAMWIPDFSRFSGPAYAALAEAIGTAISEGDLSAGERLPPQRDLAWRLGLSLSTVTRGYGEAVRRGFLEGSVGRGTYVRDAKAVTAAASGAWNTGLARPAGDAIDFANNLPPLGGAERQLAETLRAISGEPGLAAFLDHWPGRTAERHAEAAGAWIETLGLSRQGRAIVLTNGSQQGLFVALLALARPGDAILAEALSYAPVLAAAERLGLKVFPVAMDEEGLLPQSLEEQCKATAARLLYTMPTLHTPTTATMSEARRRAVAEVAERHGIDILEDDVFGFLPRSRPAPLGTYLPEQTIYVASTSKSLAPGLRVGYLSAPVRHEKALRAGVALSSWMPPPLMAEIATRWIEDGTAERLNEEKRQIAEGRQALARETLKGSRVVADPAGFHIWLHLPEGWRPDAFEAAAQREGVALRSARSFCVDPAVVPSAVRLCLSHEASQARVEDGLLRLKRLLDEKPGEAAFIV